MHTERINDSPHLLKICGLQWLHRLCQEPRRLWRRYLFNNPRFVFEVAKQFIGYSKANLNRELKFNFSRKGNKRLNMSTKLR